MDYTDKLTELYQQAQSAPEDTKIQLDLYQKAVNFIEAHHIKTDLAFNVKRAYIECGNSTGYTKLVLPLFATLLKQMDEEGMDNFKHTRSVLWMYKWMITLIVCHSSFSKSAILKMLDDMCSRFQEYNSNKQVIYDYAYFIYYELGMTKEALASKEKLLANEGRSALSDCTACVTAGIGSRIFEPLSFEEYLTINEPIITGKSRCSSVPRYQNSQIALAYLFVEGLSKNAKKFAKRDDKDITIRENCLTFCSYAIIYRVLIGDLDKAILFANRQISQLFKPVDDIDKLTFYRAGLILSERLKAVGKEWTDLPALPELDVPAVGKEDFLHQYFKSQFDDLLTAFDTRNENTVFSERERGLYNYFVAYKSKEQIKTHETN